MKCDYRKNQFDHVAQHFTHDVRRIQQLGMMDFDQLSRLINEEDLQASIAEYNRKKGSKWYYLTQDAIINFYYEVYIIVVLINFSDIVFVYSKYLNCIWM